MSKHSKTLAAAKVPAGEEKQWIVKDRCSAAAKIQEIVQNDKPAAVEVIKERGENFIINVKQAVNRGSYEIQQDFNQCEIETKRNLTISNGLWESDRTEVVVNFFKLHKCSALIPKSAVVAVFGTHLTGKEAFLTGVRSAPIWECSENKVVGIITVTDFIRNLLKNVTDSGYTTLEKTIEEILPKRPNQHLIYVDPNKSVFEAICKLVNKRIHSLPIIEGDGNTQVPLHILTHKRILKFLFEYVRHIPRPTFFNRKLRELGIGTFGDVLKVREDDLLTDVLTQILDRKVSAVPVIDESGKLVDIYSRFDILYLAKSWTSDKLDLAVTIKQANEYRPKSFDGIRKCTKEESFFDIMERIVQAEVQRLVVVDVHEIVEGIISLSDILQYLVMRPEVREGMTTEIREMEDYIPLIPSTDQ